MSVEEDTQVDVGRKCSIYKAYRELLEQILEQDDVEELKYIQIKIAYHSNNNDEKKGNKDNNYRFMFWETINSSMFDFFSELQEKMNLDDLKTYVITTAENIRLIDQEDFYGAIIEYLKEKCCEDQPMEINIRKHVYKD